ncbi:bZIP transcription factor [Sansalvadorimonas verongulae]|uniref:bZIP transcription factor n=1 Tax=Sansalvadorimonas verongulae TaxID=2172824 RepID=UPI0012BD383F|nr:bZIP transcription factor [Sansalvadorimonas verongulae]MTI13743.1 Preprotein translocase subunit SecY [Sansalvadorimonas verongulae]
MNYQQQIGSRFPKGRFAMVSVYSFTGAAIVASTIFSLLLFLSINDGLLMKVLFGGLAIIFEAGKFYAWYEFGERRAHQNLSGAVLALVFYLVLAAISIGGSVGGINSATNSAQGHIAIQQAKIATYNREIESIEKQIQLNNIAAQKYIEMERIATGVGRIQKENAKLRKEQQMLAQERDSLPPVAQGSVIGLIESLAKAFGTSSSQAQLGLVVFLSILLDFFAAFFVGVIGEEQRFCYFYRNHEGKKAKPVDTKAGAETELAGLLPHFEQKQVEQEKPSEPDPIQILLDKIISAITNKEVVCTKRAVTKHFALNAEEADSLFEKLVEQGRVGKKANNHYYWLGA